MAKRARKTKTTTTEQENAGTKVPGVVDDTLVKQACEECSTLEIEYQKQREEASKAQGAYRAKLKHFKKLGVPIEAVTKWIADKKREPEDVAKEQAEIDRVRRIMGLPVGTQIDIFGETLKQAIPLDQMTTAEAHDRGYAAAKAGTGIKDNPFIEAGFHTLAKHWTEGWNDYAEEVFTPKGGAGKKKGQQPSDAEQPADVVN